MHRHPNRPLEQEGTTRELSGGTVLWIFVALELLTFGLFFIAYASARRADPATFAAGTAQLHTFLGAVNTCVLLTGGLFAAQGVLANARGLARSASACLWAAALSGVVFMAIKLYEYADVLGPVTGKCASSELHLSETVVSGGAKTQLLLPIPHDLICH